MGANGSSFAISPVTQLFWDLKVPNSVYNFEVGADGQRFLVVYKPELPTFGLRRKAIVR